MKPTEGGVVPGHILIAQCECGFERELWPGATFETLRVIAYTADGRDLITIESEEAKRRFLTVIENPRLKEIMEAEEKGQFGIPARGPWGPYGCPSCGQQSLQLEHRGNWD